MLPKLLLAPMRTYLRMLAKTLRPSITPSSSTIRHFSSRITSADFFGDVHGRIDADADVRGAQGGASLMPSPMNPTVCWRACRALMMRCLWAGERRANSVASFRRVRQLIVGQPLDLAAEQHDGPVAARPPCRSCGRPARCRP